MKKTSIHIILLAKQRVQSVEQATVSMTAFITPVMYHISHVTPCKQMSCGENSMSAALQQTTLQQCPHRICSETALLVLTLWKMMYLNLWKRGHSDMSVLAIRPLRCIACADRLAACVKVNYSTYVKQFRCKRVSGFVQDFVFAPSMKLENSKKQIQG